MGADEFGRVSRKAAADRRCDHFSTRLTTFSSASAARTVVKSSRLRRCSTATPRREFACAYCDTSDTEGSLTRTGDLDAHCRWNHLRNEDLAKNHDLLLRAEHGVEGVTACFQCKRLSLATSLTDLGLSFA